MNPNSLQWSSKFAPSRCRFNVSARSDQLVRLCSPPEEVVSLGVQHKGDLPVEELGPCLAYSHVLAVPKMENKTHTRDQ